jgi:hypothetical protein
LVRGLRDALRRRVLHGSVAEPRDSEDTAAPGTISKVSAGLSTLKVTAALVLIGFVGKLAQEQFLGIPLGNWTALDMSIFAGHWAVDTLTIALDELMLDKKWFLLPLCLLLTPLAISTGSRLRTRDAWLWRYLSIGVCFYGLLTVLVWCEMPTLAINDWLTRPLSDQVRAPLPGLMHGREADLMASVFVLRMGGLAKGKGQDECSSALPADAGPGTGGRPPQSAADRFSLLGKYLRKDDPTGDRRDALNRLYGYSVALCGIGWLTFWLHPAPGDKGTVARTVRLAWIVVMLFLLPVTTCLLPYTYCKLLFSTSLPSAVLTMADKGTPPDGDLLLLDRTDSDLSLLRNVRGEPVPMVVMILKRGDVKTLELGKSHDAVADSIANCDWVTQ